MNSQKNVNKPKILGVVFDNLISSSAYAQLVHGKLQGRDNVLKALAGSSWAKDKETLVSTYKAIGISVLNYSASIWTSQLCDTSLVKLQTAQNTALRLATGCHLMARVSHIYTKRPKCCQYTHTMTSCLANTC